MRLVEHNKNNLVPEADTPNHFPSMKFFLISLMVFSGILPVAGQHGPLFRGNYFSGRGDVEYLAQLDSAYSLLRPNAQLENLSMLYKKDWNGFVEGPTLNAWWIQNSFGPTYTMMPFMDQAYQTFVYNSQAMWFALQGNGKRKDNNGYTGPVGVLTAGRIEGLKKTGVFYAALIKAGKEDTYACKHAGLILQCIESIDARKKLKQSGELPLLPEKSQRAVDDLYIRTVVNLQEGLIQYIEKCNVAVSGQERAISALWPK